MAVGSLVAVSRAFLSVVGLDSMSDMLALSSPTSFVLWLRRSRLRRSMSSGVRLDCSSASATC
eukprot:8920130-Pyramimonas_sp.AAC.1